jgi:hypothetical protein
MTEKDDDPFGWEDMKRGQRKHRLIERKAVQLVKVESKSAIPGFVAIVMCDDGSLWGITEKGWDSPQQIHIPRK